MRACHRTLLTRHGSEAAPSHSADDFIGENRTNNMEVGEITMDNELLYAKIAVIPMRACHRIAVLR